MNRPLTTVVLAAVAAFTLLGTIALLRAHPSDIPATLGVLAGLATGVLDGAAGVAGLLPGHRG